MGMMRSWGDFTREHYGHGNYAHAHTRSLLLTSEGSPDPRLRVSSLPSSAVGRHMGRRGTPWAARWITACKSPNPRGSCPRRNPTIGGAQWPCRMRKQEVSTWHPSAPAPLDIGCTGSLQSFCPQPRDAENAGAAGMAVAVGLVPAWQPTLSPALQEHHQGSPAPAVQPGHAAASNTWVSNSLTSSCIF